MKVSLRKRKNRTGIISLYLDICYQGGREYEYLQMYLVHPKTKEDRKANKETIALAEAVRGQRQMDIQKGLYGFKSQTVNGKQDFIAFYEKLLAERYESKNNYDNWFGALKYLKEYSKNKIQFKDLTPEFVDGFKQYLLSVKVIKRGTKLAQNSAVSYFNKFRAAINKAFELDMIEKNPVKMVKAIKQAESKREYLTLEELKKLKEVECRYPILKKAFLFSALTGLRWSDINKLVWKEVQHSESSGWSLVFRQQKTDGQEYLPINLQAIEFLPERGNPDDRVFQGLKYSAEMNIALARWVLLAGITKKISFHCARHTNATLLITSGVDIYTVSKMLGHRDLKTTQIYAKIIDQKKIDAANLIPHI
jgi:integrase